MAPLQFQDVNLDIKKKVIDYVCEILQALCIRTNTGLRVLCLLYDDRLLDQKT